MNNFKKVLLVTFAWAGFGCAQASDIDIFGGSGGSALPNIVIVFDNASRNNSNFSGSCTDVPAITISNLQDATRCALATTALKMSQQQSLLSHFRMGLMVYGYQNNQGGQWIIPNITPGASNVSTPLPLMDQTGINNFVASVTPTINTANNASSSGGMQEAWAFFTGDARAGSTQFGSHTTYTSKFGIACQKSFIIFIGAATGNNGEPETGNTGAVGGASALAFAGATATQQQQINTSNIGPNTGADSAWGDEWARFLYQTDFNSNQNDRQNIVTYTIATGGTRPNYVQFLQSMANQGGGKAFVAADINAMVQALLAIFNEIAAVNSVFASSSLPLSTNTQGTYLNQIFIGMFRPDGNDYPRWLGNLKQYQFGVGGTAANPTLFLADSGGAPAISSAGTGFISPNAVSFWTSKNTATLPDSIGGFYVNNPQGVGGGFDSPDGEFVEKGGVAQRVRMTNLQDDYATNPHSPRNLYTCIGTCASGSSLSGFNFATDNASIDNAALGITAPTSSLSSLTRNGATVTASLSAVPSAALTNGQNVTIQGAAYPELNGNFNISVVNSTTFTYAITESPPQGTNSTGTYTASLPSAPKSISSLTRAGTNSLTLTTPNGPSSRVTATVASHGYSVGQMVTISGANGAEYNGTFAVETVSSNSFTYIISDGPATPGGGGTAQQGVCPGSGCTSLTIPANAITRGVTAAGNTSTVTINNGASLPSGKFQAGSTVTITGATPSAYNGTYTITAGNANNSCGFNGNSGRNVFCFTMNTTPTTPDAGANKTVDSTGTVSVSLQHPVTCTSGSPATTVTATASAGHSFQTGNSISIAGNPVGANENRYVGTYTVTRLSSTQFTYSITVSPAACTFSTSGVTVVTNSGGVDRTAFINWVRGQDNVGDEQSPGNGVTVRPSIHGDVLHSRPTVLNYGSSTGVVLFYGSNDGVFRAVNGNQPLAGGNIGGAPPGGEIWGFIPTEFYSKLKRQYLNSPAVLLATTPTGLNPTPTEKDYFFDGSTGVYQDTATSTVYLFLSSRRGGRMLYALNVSNPANPRFMWKRTNADSGYTELGQTWSTPKVAKVKGHSNPVLIFAGGYDPNQDNDPVTTADTMGRAIFIVDATNGNIVWRAQFASGGGAGTCTGNPCQLSDMTYSIPSDVTLLNRDYDQTGYIDRLYVGDTGGNIWRVDLEPDQSNTAPSTWKVTKFAALGGSGTPKRKFFYPPDVVTTKLFDMVLASTGDREHPLYSASTASSYAVVNRFYALKDVNIGFDAGTPTTIADGTASNGNAAPTSITDATTSPYNINSNNDGFFIRMANAGEKGVNAPTTIGGYTYFGTSTPPAPTTQACNNLGTARGYQVNFITGESGSVIFDGGGLPPSPVGGLVTVSVNGEDKTLPFCIGCGNPGPSCSGPDCKSSLGGIKPPIPVPPVRKRLFWYLDKHDN